MYGAYPLPRRRKICSLRLPVFRNGTAYCMVATIDLTWTFENGNIKILWGDANEDGNDRTYSYPLRKVVPWMKEQGLPKATIDKFLIANPQRLFTWSLGNAPVSMFFLIEIFPSNCCRKALRSFFKG